MRAIVICNPAAGHHSCEGEMGPLISYLTGQGVQVDTVEITHGPADATTFARKAARTGCDVVFLAGGDGTIAQAVDGLVNTETALAVLPGGSGNVLARQLNLPVPGGLHPHPILEAARLLLEGQVRRVDVGRITPRGSREPARHFLCWSGVGFDAQVNRVVEADLERKRRLGPLATALAAFLTVRDYAGTSARLRVDGRRVNRRLIMLVASNIQLYGIIFRMAERAVMDDGRLDVYAFQGSGPLRTVLHAIRLLLRKHIEDPEVDIYRAQRIEISTYRPLPVHVDGDYIGLTPIVIEVVPKALNLLVPPCAPASLFQDGGGMLPPETPWEWVQRMAREIQSAIKERSAVP
ncbi:MAG: diacylglycerol kinase family lipid kinase [Anaerolineae bacterium]|nr:diacylglycerol kinase family lipid kinase [Anaerolineae bacterium]